MTISTDRVVSLSAMLVAAGSLGMVVYQTQVMHASQRASVLPYLTISLMASDEATHVVVRNAGVGPALLRDVRIRHRGRELALDPHDFYISQHGAESGAGLSVDKLIPGRLISPGEWLSTLGAEGEQRDALGVELLGLFDLGEVPDSWYAAAGVTRSGPDKAVIELTYESVFGERWRVASDTIVPQRID